MRFAPPSQHRGKRGAYRVGYAYFRIDDTVYLIGMFGKNEKANFTADEKASLRTLMAHLSKYHLPSK